MIAYGLADIRKVTLQALKKKQLNGECCQYTENDAFLIADCNLDCQPYNTTRTDVTWETSTLRSWLNGYNAGYNANGIDYSSNNFIDKAFTSAEQNAINQVTIVNDDSAYKVEGGNDTKDKIFLLSIEEVTNSDYGFSYGSYIYDNVRYRKNTAYAKEKGAWTHNDDADEYYAKCNGNGRWWLRTPGADASRASHVSSKKGTSTVMVMVIL